MKKLFYAFCVVAMAFAVTSCKKPNNPIDVDDLAEDGVYVFGEATGFDKVDPLLLMANGINEAKDQTLRDGMFEKYIVLQGGKEFSLVWVNAGEQTLYGATLAEFTPAELTGIYDSNPATAIFKGKLEIGENAPKMKMTSTGLYHIVLDLNKNNDLAEPQILVAPVQWGVRGGMNNWGFTALEATAPSNDGITYTLSGQELGNNGDFKFAYNGAWKITLDDKGEVKANTNLGQDCKPGGANIVVSEGAGKYKVTLTYKLAAGAIENCFTYKTELEEAASYPENIYMIGAAFGGWSWESEDVVTLQHISAGGDPKDGCFVVTRYFKADDGFKFATGKEWGKAFGGMTTNPENITWDGDGNIHVPSDGLWTFTLDYTTDQMSLNEGMVYGMGPAFNGDWTMGKFPGTVNADGTASITALSDGALRVYAPCAFDWWQHEFQPDAAGNLVYREGGELESFNVAAGDVITFDFNAGTATMGAPSEPVDLWEAIDDAHSLRYFMYMNIAEDWSNAKYDNVETTECPLLVATDANYIFALPDQTYARWQNQIFFHPYDESHFIALNPAKNYHFAFSITSTETFKGFFKLEKYNAAGAPKYEGEVIWEPEKIEGPDPSNLNLVVGETLTMEYDFTGVEASNIVLVFDFGTNPAGAVVTIKDITLIEK